MASNFVEKDPQNPVVSELQTTSPRYPVVNGLQATAANYAVVSELQSTAPSYLAVGELQTTIPNFPVVSELQTTAQLMMTLGQYDYSSGYHYSTAMHYGPHLTNSMSTPVSTGIHLPSADATPYSVGLNSYPAHTSSILSQPESTIQTVSNSIEYQVHAEALHDLRNQHLSDKDLKNVASHLYPYHMYTQTLEARPMDYSPYEHSNYSAINLMKSSIDLAQKQSEKDLPSFSTVECPISPASSSHQNAELYTCNQEPEKNAVSQTNSETVKAPVLNIPEIRNAFSQSVENPLELYKWHENAGGHSSIDSKEHLEPHFSCNSKEPKLDECIENSAGHSSNANEEDQQTQFSFNSKDSKLDEGIKNPEPKVDEGQDNETTNKCICNEKTENSEDISNKIVEERFTCGGCANVFSTICLLHAHIKNHSSGGSYHFDNGMKTAFPKYDSVCNFSQTENKKEQSTPETRKGKKHKYSKKKCNLLNGNDAEEITTLDNMAGDFNSDTDDYDPGVSVHAKILDNIQTLINDTFDADKPGNDGVGIMTIKEEPVDSFDAESMSKANTFKVKMRGRGRPKKISEPRKDKKKISKSSLKRKHISGIKIKIQPVKEQTQDIPLTNETDDEETVNKSEKEDNCNSDNDMITGIDDILRPAKKFKRAKTKNELKQKQKRSKEDYFPVCKICGLTIPRYNYEQHLRKHSGEKPFTCEKCGKSFTHARSVQRHLLTHDPVKPFKCHFCPGQFCEKREFEMHMKKHADDRPHQCNVCDMRFLSQRALYTHQENIHMGLTKFECDICNRRFYKHSGLTAHKTVHFEATLKCQYCDKKFRDKTALRRHESTHTGDKNFKCHICDHAFIQSTPFWAHMEKRHCMSRTTVKELLREKKEEKLRLAYLGEIGGATQKRMLMEKEEAAQQQTLTGGKELQDIIVKNEIADLMFKAEAQMETMQNTLSNSNQELGIEHL